MTKPVYKPSQVMRMVDKGEIADPQPRKQGRIMCEKARHKIRADTESPIFWENGSYLWCSKCKGMMLARVEFKTFEIDMTGERKRYPLKQTVA